MKKNKTIIIIIAVLILVSLGIAIYGFLSKEENEEEKPNKTEPNTHAQYDEKIIESYFTNFGKCASGYELEFNEDKKLSLSSLPQSFINNTMHNYLQYSKKIKS